MDRLCWLSLEATGNLVKGFCVCCAFWAMEGDKKTVSDGAPVEETECVHLAWKKKEVGGFRNLTWLACCAC